MTSTRAIVACVLTGLLSILALIGCRYWPWLVWPALGLLCACLVLFILAVLTPPPAPVLRCQDCAGRLP